MLFDTAAVYSRMYAAAFGNYGLSARQLPVKLFRYMEAQNVNAAVDTTFHFIVAHEVTNETNDRYIFLITKYLNDPCILHARKMSPKLRLDEHFPRHDCRGKFQ